MDKIYIEDLEIYAYHGVNIEEKNMGQRFLICAELELDLSAAGTSDDLTKTIHYGELCLEIEEEFKRNKYDLIEKAAEELARFILLKYEEISKIKLMVKKPWAPIGKPIKYAAVEVDRMWHTAYIGVGSNMGDKKENIMNAIDMINESKYTKVTKVADMYVTKPVGYEEQDDFLNTALQIKTILNPKELIKLLLDIEKTLKRERIIKWGPRTIDLDVLFYDDIITECEEIIVPHPRLHERMFVLKPLSDISPYLMHPVLKKRIFELENEINIEQ